MMLALQQLALVLKDYFFFLKNITKSMKCVLFIRTQCFQNVLYSLSDFEASGENKQFHKLGHVGEQFCNFICFLIIGVF